MAVAVLSDDTALFNKAAKLFRDTTTNYFRWGRDPAFSAGRTLGECTETLRVSGDRTVSEHSTGSLCTCRCSNPSSGVHSTAPWYGILQMPLGCASSDVQQWTLVIMEGWKVMPSTNISCLCLCLCRISTILSLA